MEISNILSEINSNTEELIYLVKDIHENVPHEKTDDKWNVLEVLEHVYKTEKVVIHLLKKPTEDFHDGEELIGKDKMERLIFKSRHHNFEAPTSLHPTGEISNIQQFIELFSQLRNQLNEDISNQIIVLDNKTYKHPFLGQMTVLDWLNFLVYHNKRHQEQIKDLISK